MPVERCETEMKINVKNISSPYAKRIQFPLTLAWVCTIYKIQGLTRDVGVVGFELNKQKQSNGRKKRSNVGFN